MKQTWKRIGSLLLTVCMVFTLLPTMAFAETGVTDSGTPLGISGEITAFADLDTEVAQQAVETGTPEDALKLPDTLAVTVAENGDETAMGSDSWKKKEDAVAVEHWISDPAYDGDTAGDYMFIPTLALPEGWRMAEGVTLPTVMVTVWEEIAAPMARGAGLLGDTASITTETDLQYALESTTPSTITLGNDITLSTQTVNMGASHTIDTDSFTLTISGGETYSTGGRIDLGPHTLMLKGTVVIDSVQGIRSAKGTLNLEDVTVTLKIANSIYSGTVHVNSGATVNLDSSRSDMLGGALLTLRDSTYSLNVNSGGVVNILDANGIGINNSSGGMININSGGTISVGAIGSNNWGISQQDSGALKLNGGTLTGTAGGAVLLGVGTKVDGMNGKFIDRGTTLTAAGEVTVGAAGATPSASGLSIGLYVWNGSAFAKTGIITSAEPQNATVTAGTITESLSVTATASNSETVGYQWYECDANGYNGNIIAGATSNAFSIPTGLTAGSYYYCCVLTATGCDAVRTRTVTVTVNPTGTPSAPTVSGFRAVRRDADRVSFFFTPSTIGKYGYSILKQGLEAPSNISMLFDIMSIGEFNIDARQFGTTAADILVVYLQIENAESVKSQIYSLEVPAYTPPTNAEPPSIDQQPMSSIYVQNETVLADLTVWAFSTDGGALSYQWYSNTTNSTVGGTPVAGLTSNWFTPSTATVGTTYYYCVVTNTNDKATTNKTATTTSDIAAITVIPAGGTIIRSVTITGIVEPVGGASPVKTGATVPADANYVLKGLVWIDDENKTEPLADGAKFEAGKHYYCGVSVQLPYGHSFAYDVTATINGKTATVMLDGTTEAVVTYLFTAKDVADTPTITVTKHPQNVTVTQGQISGKLTTEAVASNGKLVSYQWYRWIGGIGSDNTEIMTGETNNTLTIPTNLTAGTYRYSCTYTAEGCEFVEGNVAIVTVKEPSGGGGGGGGSGYTPTSIIPTDKQPDMPTVAKPSVSGMVKEGILSATITEQMVKDALKAAQDAAKKSGKELDGIALDFNVTGSGSYTNLNATIDAGAIDRLKEAGLKFIKIGSAVLDVTLDMGAIAEIDKQSTGAVTVSANRITKLSDAAKKLIGNRPVFDIAVSYQKNGKTEYVSNFGKGEVTLGIAYKATEKENKGNLFGVYVDKNGKPQLLSNSSYDNSGRLIFSRNSLSTYGVGYKAPNPAFSDTAKHWAKDNIDFVASRDLISGTSATTFVPNTAITRADFLMALGRLSGVDVSIYKTSSFIDVKTTDTVMPYIEWAVKNKIVSGYGNGKFGPNDSITREQMAVMMVNYAKATDYKLPVSIVAVTFADNTKISAYVKDAVKEIQQAGVINGKDNNRFDPQGNATRAEAATILRRFVELVIDEGTARGWVQNDVGRWQWIGENGKPVTGWLTIENGKWYYFYADGSLAKSTKVDGYEVGPDGVRKTK